MDRFEFDGLHDEKWLRSCEEFDSLSENRIISFDQQAICNQLLFKLQTITVCTHVPKHLQFVQINKKFQSDVNKKLIVQRSDLNLLFSGETIHSRIEPKQLRKTVILQLGY